MKKLLTLLLLATSFYNVVSEDFLTGGTYVASAVQGAKYNLVGQTTTETQTIVEGRTYSSEMDVFEVVTKENEHMKLHLSSGVLVDVLPETTFSVDAFNQMVKNNDAEPELAVSTDYILNMSLLSGDAYVVSPKYDSPNTMCVLQTALANLELNGGTYRINSSQKYVICYVLDGQVQVFNPKTNKKESITKGQMAFIVPFPGDSGVLVTSKTIDGNELTTQYKEVKEVEKIKDDVIFAIINKKIVGIKVK